MRGGHLGHLLPCGSGCRHDSRRHRRPRLHVRALLADSRRQVRSPRNCVRRRATELVLVHVLPRFAARRTHVLQERRETREYNQPSVTSHSPHQSLIQLGTHTHTSTPTSTESHRHRQPTQQQDRRPGTFLTKSQRIPLRTHNATTLCSANNVRSPGHVPELHQRLRQLALHRRRSQWGPWRPRRHQRHCQYYHLQ